MGMWMQPWCSLSNSFNAEPDSKRTSGPQLCRMPPLKSWCFSKMVEAKFHRLLLGKSYVLMSRQLRVFQKFNITLNWVYDGGLVKFFGCFFGFCFFNLCESKPFEGTKEPWGVEIILLIRWTELSDIVGGMRCHDMSPGYLTSIGHVARSLWNFGCGGGAKPLRHHERCSLHNIYEQVNDYINCT